MGTQNEIGTQTCHTRTGRPSHSTRKPLPREKRVEMKPFERPCKEARQLNNRRNSGPVETPRKDRLLMQLNWMRTQKLYPVCQPFFVTLAVYLGVRTILIFASTKQ